MANTIYTPVTLDVGGKNNLKVWAKQYDSNDRWITATIVNGDALVRVDPDSVVTINARREDDEQNAFVGEVNSDGTVNLPITYWMTYVAGTVSCDVSFYLDGRLSSLTFKLKVEEAVTDPSEVIPAEDRDIVTALINDCQDATSDAEAATSSALSSAQAATTAAGNADTKADEAEIAATRATAAGISAENAAERAEAAAEQLDVDLTEIRSDIAENTRRLDNLDASDVSFNESSDPNVEMVSDELLKLEDDVSGLDNRLTSAEGNISSLSGRMGIAEDNIVQAQNNIGSLSQNKEDKTNKVTAVNSSSTDEKYPSAKAVYDAVKVKADSSSLIPIMNALNTKENVANKVQEITDEQGASDYPSVPAVIDYIDEELSYVQNKSERVTVVNEQSSNNTYPTSKAVYDAIQAGGGGASAMMVTFTITGVDTSGNYTGVADKTYTEMSAALTRGEVVRGQIALGNDNYISYSVMKDENNIRFFTAAFDVNFSLVVEYSESGGEEQVATFTVYALNLANAETVSSLGTAVDNIWDVSRYVMSGNTGWNSKVLYKYQASLLGQTGNVMVVQFFTQSTDPMYLRNMRDGTYIPITIADLKTVLDDEGFPNSVSTISGKNAITFEFPTTAKSLVYDLADSSLKVVGLSLTDSQICLISRPYTNSVFGLFVDFAHNTYNQSPTIALPT